MYGDAQVKSIDNLIDFNNEKCIQYGECSIVIDTNQNIFYVENDKW